MVDPRYSFDDLDVALDLPPQPKRVEVDVSDTDGRPGTAYDADCGLDDIVMLVLEGFPFLEETMHDRRGHVHFGRVDGVNRRSVTAYSPEADSRGVASISVWSDNPQLVEHGLTNGTYTAFQVLAFGHHRGDFVAAARELRSQGYGDDGQDAESVREEPKLLERFRVSDILHLADEPIKFVIKGFLIDGTHGMIAGEDKSLKSYIGTIIDISIISGVALFDRFVIERSGPVVVYVGEGGKRQYLRRVKRICEAMGLDAEAVTKDYHILTETAPIGSVKFQMSLERDLSEIHPVLIRMDPYYAYHGGEADPRNLHQEGANLNLISEPAYKHNSNALISNHFNQGGKGLNRKRITMAGGAEWVDSWILVEKYGGEEAQDVLNGNFVLRLKVGGREIGEQQWELRLSIGRFDMENNEHVGDVAWSIRPLLASPDVAVPKNMAIRREAIDTLIEHPWELSKSDLKKRITGNDGGINAFLTSELKRTGKTQLIMEREVPTTDRIGRTVKRRRLGLSRPHPDVPDDYPYPPEGSTRA